MARYIDADKLRERDFGDFGYEMRYEIDRTPTEDVRPVVRGKWIQTEEGKYKCSACGGKHTDTETGDWVEVFDFKYPFCPLCGADMREENKNE